MFECYTLYYVAGFVLPSSYSTAFLFKCLQILRTTLDSYCKHVRHTQSTCTWGRLLMPCYIQKNGCNNISSKLHTMIKISRPNVSQGRDTPARKAPQYTDSTQTPAV
ncbi:hypothetical protein EB796_009613 [Bugula neritina]|uniref:Uncharacterized protein n=1 Tax=Bugula neritina TaxID=10212 RepID=A0A7J7K1Q9_BUGNE|nr:hypothetical protein EB796_009613 [Bugula neritina]